MGEPHHHLRTLALECAAEEARPDLEPDKTGETGELILAISQIARECKGIACRGGLKRQRDRRPDLATTGPVRSLRGAAGDAAITIGWDKAARDCFAARCAPRNDGVIWRSSRCYQASRPRVGRAIGPASESPRAVACSASCLSNMALAAALRLALNSARLSPHH